MTNKNHLNKIYVLFEKEYKELKERYLNNLQQIQEIKNNNHLIKILQNSKNLRSIFLFLLIKSAGREISTQDIINGVAIEIFHTASLLHDDIVDIAKSRRGLESVNQKFGYAKAAIIGDRLSLISYSLILKNNNKDIHKLFFELIKNMSVSQLDEINNSYEIKTTIQDYIHSIKGKTVDFFSFIAYLATENIKEKKEMKQNYLSLSANLGVLFQLKDDLIDIFSLKSGKERLNDLKNGKITLPLIILKNHLNNQELFNLFNTQDNSLFYEVLTKYDIKKKADNIIKTKAEECQKKINLLPYNSYTIMIKSLVSFLCNRDY